MTIEELREKIARDIDDNYQLHSKRGGRFVFTAKHSANYVTDKLLSTLIPKKCPECVGVGERLSYENQKIDTCLNCNGTGKVSLTLKELVEEYQVK